MKSPEQPSPNCLTEGQVYRQSPIVDGIVNKRYGVLYAQNFVTFRRHAKAGKKQLPTKVWPLDEGCEISDLTRKDFIIKEGRINTLWSLATGRYSKKELHSFSVRWPQSAVLQDALILAFKDGEEGAKWHTAFTEAVAALRDAESRAEPSTPATPPRDPYAQSEPAPTVREDLKHPAAQAPAPSRPSLSELTVSSSFRLEIPPTPAAQPLPSGGGAGPSSWQRSARRTPFRHINSVTVYEERDDGAFMISAVVRGTPEATFNALMAREYDTPLLLASTLGVEEVEAHSRVLRGRVRIPPALRLLCAPRDLRLLQTWRRDEDGTLIVLMHSADPDGSGAGEPASRGASLGRWFAPIRAEVVAANYTIAPLQPRFLGDDGVSHECLVTLILQMDLGGWLSTRSPFACLLAPIAGQFLSESGATAVIALRDKVEQERFVVAPFATGHPKAGEEGPEPDPSPGPTPKRDRAVSVCQARQFPPVVEEDGELAPRASAGASAATPRTPPGWVPTSQSDGLQANGELRAGPLDDSSWAKGTCLPKYWSCPGAAGFKVRGHNYLKDKKKVLAGEPIFRLASVDHFEIEAPTTHIARFLPSIQESCAPFTFILQLMVPGPPYLALVIAWAADFSPSERDHPDGTSDNGTARSDLGEFDSEDDLGGSPFDVCLARFLAGDDADDTARRNRTLKLIPHVVSGNWMIRQSVGSTPVLLGRKVATTYFRSAHYFEADVDVGSSRPAWAVVGLVAPATKSLVIDMALVLEGHAEEELPEQLLGTVRFSHIDMRDCPFLDTTTGQLLPKGAATPRGGATPRGPAPPRLSTAAAARRAMGSDSS